MNKISLIFVSCLFLITIIFVNCKKDNPISQSKQEKLSDANVEAKIKAFNSKLESTVKTDETYTIADAVWNVEAALNYNFCRVDLPQTNTFEDSIFLSLPIENNLINFFDIADIYQQALEHLQIMLLQKNTHAVVVDVKPLQAQSNQLNIKISFVIAESNQAKTTYPNSFGSSEYWIFGNLMGKCDGSGLYQGVSDAAEEIQYWILSGFAATPPGSYYTDIVEPWVYAIQPGTWAYNYDNPTDYVIDNMYDSRMFVNRKYYNSQWLANYDVCMTPTEMNFYANGTIWVMNNYISAGGARPTGKAIITINLFGQVYCEDPQTCSKSIISHAGIFKYGILHMGNEN